MKFPLTNTHLCAEIDDEDSKKLLQHSSHWSVDFRYNKTTREFKLVRVKAKSAITGKTISMGAAILGVVSDRDNPIDHIDRDPLNNKKDNLRHTTRKINSANRGAYNGRKYKGVYKETDLYRSGYRVEIRHSNGLYKKRGFDTEHAAILHANTKLLELHGVHAYQNPVN